MNDEVKEVLISLIDYYNAIGTDEDLGFGAFSDLVQRASKALERHAIGTEQTNNDVDPFKSYDEFPDYIVKMEEEW